MSASAACRNDAPPVPAGASRHDVVISFTGQYHRAECSHAPDELNRERVGAGRELVSDVAPALCQHRRPDLTLLLSHEPPPRRLTAGAKCARGTRTMTREATKPHLPAAWLPF